MTSRKSSPSPGRRRLLGSLAAGGFAASQAGAAELLKPLEIASWSKTPGAPILEHPYGLPSRYKPT